MAANKSVAKEDQPATVGAVVEDITKSAFAEAVSPEPEIKPAEQKDVAAKEPADNSGGICVYLGPSIHGVIQSGTVYGGTKSEVESQLAAAIQRYPLIAALIVTGETLAADRIKAKTPGTLLSNAYMKLASGRKTM